MSAHSMLRRASYWLFPPACRGCGERFDIFRTTDPLPLCPACLERWAKAAAQPCRFCGTSVGRCDCMPPLLREAGCAALLKAVGYHPDRRELPERLILYAKRARDRELFRFFAADLQLRLWETLSRVDGLETACVSCVPRRSSAAGAAGVDQGRELAVALAKALELPYFDTLRNRSTVAQKSLGGVGRAENATASIAAAKGRRIARVWGRTVVLVDDITTAGATLAAGCRALLAAGAERVVCVVVGMTSE